MNPYHNCPEVLGFLRVAKEHPEDNAPRLILADWLQENGDPDRAEFIRLQCRSALGAVTPPSREERAAMSERMEQLLGRHGGIWAGPLWNWRRTDYAWRRGFLAVRLTRPLEGVPGLDDVLPWIDGLYVEVRGRRMLEQAAELLNLGSFNRFTLTLHRWFTDPLLLDCLGRVRESRCLRSLAFWCVRPAGRRPALAQRAGKSALRPSHEFLSRLIRDLPLGRHLTRLGVGPRLSPEEDALIRSLGIEPFDAQGLGWME